MWHDWHDRKSGWKRFSHHNLYIHEWNRFKQGLEIADIYVCGWFKVIRLALTLLSQSVRVSVRPGEEIKQSHRPTFIRRTFIALFIFLLPESPRWWGRLSASSYSLALILDQVIRPWTSQSSMRNSYRISWQRKFHSLRGKRVGANCGITKNSN